MARTAEARLRVAVARPGFVLDGLSRTGRTSSQHLSPVTVPPSWRRETARYPLPGFSSSVPPRARRRRGRRRKQKFFYRDTHYTVSGGVWGLLFVCEGV